MVWYGQLTTPRRLRARGLGVLSGAVLWLVVFLVVPSLVLAALAFAQRTEYGQISWQFTLGNFHRLLGFGILQWSPDYVLILGRSVWIALVTTVVCLLLAYPLAFYIAARPPRMRYVLLALVIIPSCTNLVIRTYAWRLILDAQMPPAQIAHALGLIPADAALYPGAFAVYVGMVNSFLPLAVLPLYASVERHGLVARRGGAGPLRLEGARVHARRAAADALRPDGRRHPHLHPRDGGLRRAGPARRRQLHAGGQPDPAAVRHQPRHALRGGAVSLALLVVTLVGLFAFRRPGREMDLA